MANSKSLNRTIAEKYRPEPGVEPPSLSFNVLALHQLSYPSPIQVCYENSGIISRVLESYRACGVRWWYIHIIMCVGCNRTSRKLSELLIKFAHYNLVFDR